MKQCSVENNNLKNLKNVKIGMHYNQVILIMKRKPYKIQTDDFEPEEFIALYESPISSSGNFSITYSKNDSIVKRIYRGD